MRNDPVGDPSGLLFHYTSFEGFLNIVKTGAFWASDLVVMNDPDELIYVGKVLKRFLGSPHSVGHKRVPKKHHDLFHRYVQRLRSVDWTESGWLSDVAGRVFATSFCKQPDLLSQWRGYGLQGGGVCLGFAIATRKQQFSNAHLIAVDYVDEDEELPVLKELVLREFNILRNQLPVNEKSRILNETPSPDFWSVVAGLAPTLKRNSSQRSRSGDSFIRVIDHRQYVQGQQIASLFRTSNLLHHQVSFLCEKL